MFGEDSRPSYWTGYQRRPFSDSNTGRTAFRLAEVQQPKTVATWSCWMSLRAFSAKVGQSDAPSSMTGTICLPRTPPFALISSIAMISASFTEVSLMDIVPLRECSTPTFTDPDDVPAAEPPPDDAPVGAPRLWHADMSSPRAKIKAIAPR